MNLLWGGKVELGPEFAVEVGKSGFATGRQRKQVANRKISWMGDCMTCLSLALRIGKNNVSESGKPPVPGYALGVLPGAPIEALKPNLKLACFFLRPGPVQRTQQSQEALIQRMQAYSANDAVCAKV
jgi:hypothetical protein